MTGHPIVHIEIPGNNTKEAAAFYGDVFGWKLSHDPSFDYHMFQAEGGPGGGFVKVGVSHDDNVLIYLASDDIEADLRNVESHGGSLVTGKSEIPGTGWFAVFKDPTGNRIGLFTAINPVG